MVHRGTTKAIHNAGGGGSNPLVATIQNKGLPSGRPLLFLGYGIQSDYRMTALRFRPPRGLAATRPANPH